MADVKKIAVLGAGQMGGGIAQVAAQAGLDAVVFDSFPGAIDKCKALRAKLSSQEQDINQLEATHHHLGRQHASLVERIDRVKAQCDIRKQAAQGRVEEQLRHREAIEAGNAAAVAKLNQNEASIRAIESEMADLKASHEHQIGNVLNEYYRLLQCVDMYHQKLDESITSCCADTTTKDTTSTHSITQSLQQMMRGSLSLG